MRSSPSAILGAMAASSWQLTARSQRGLIDSCRLCQVAGRPTLTQAVPLNQPSGMRKAAAKVSA